jgi:pyruvate dehydrogenase E2 component (dihydrolipoamide acetyltransferase)
MTDVASGAIEIAPWPETDFSNFGEVEVRPQSRVQQLTARALSRNVMLIPHVTHHDQIDVTEVEDRRATWNRDQADRKLTLTPMLAKALANSLVMFPQFNASLSADGGTLLLKKYFNIGFAIDSPRGLLVGVVRQCDVKTIPQIAEDLAELGRRARDRGLSMAEMSGGCMTISSLGHIGGTAFTPIVNAPEVAILGVTRAVQQAFPDAAGGVTWRRMLPLSLSYDHRVINGADAARFTQFVGKALAELDF